MPSVGGEHVEAERTAGSWTLVTAPDLAKVMCTMRMVGRFQQLVGNEQVPAVPRVGDPTRNSHEQSSWNLETG